MCIRDRYQRRVHGQQSAVFSYRTQIYVRPTPDCQNLNFQSVSEIQNIIKQIDSFMFAMLIAQLALYGIALILIIVYIVRAIRAREFGVGHYSGVINFITWPIMIVLIVTGVIIYSDRTTFNRLGSDYNRIKDNQCFSDKNVIKVIDDTVNAVPNYVLWSIYISYALMITAASSLFALLIPVSYTHLTLPTIYSV
eukprot:TRINITY_DN6159_c0_g1_i3.p1 TRINITY_DN6159_c0_g1~~TRINITY_DN6159_c0_g1_i3.p1  ORF type:complete len:215 (+),score=42.96 TRINITY_DN6159_c0_g1_i3:62-646(+)